jgi:hypothetical protein
MTRRCGPWGRNVWLTKPWLDLLDGEEAVIMPVYYNTPTA